MKLKASKKNDNTAINEFKQMVFERMVHLQIDNTESNKELIENVVNAYMVGGIFTAIQQDASEVEEKAVKDLMDHYAKKMLLHSIKKLLDE